MIKNKLTHCLSLYDVIKNMEPFSIYEKDITYKLFENINKFIFENIQNYKIKFAERNRLFSKLFNYKSLDNNDDEMNESILIN